MHRKRTIGCMLFSLIIILLSARICLAEGKFQFIKRGYRIDMPQIKEGLPPLEITRIIKSVKYVLYWEFDTKENYGAAQKSLYDSYWKAIDKCLLVPHDKYLGEVLF